MDQTRSGGRGHGRRGSPRGPWAAVGLGLLLLGLASCGVMLDGRIYALDEAVVLPMQIETSRGHGTIRASHPSTGERLEGTYSGVAGGAAGAVLGGGPGGLVGGGGAVRRTDVPAIATLIGDQGTVLDCEMLIQAGFRPHGFGTCKDNKGRQYRLQF